MVRTKQVPLPNFEQIRLEQFFEDAVKSTPCSSSTKINVLKTSKKSSKSGSASQKNSSEGASRGKSEGASRGTSESASRKAKSEGSPPRKKRKNATDVAGEIRRLQKSTHLLIPLAAFIRVVRDALLAVEEERRKSEPNLHRGFLLNGIRFSADAIACLHEATEIQLTNFFTMSYYATMHAGRKTLMVRDCQLARLFLGRNHPLNP